MVSQNHDVEWKGKLDLFKAFVYVEQFSIYFSIHVFSLTNVRSVFWATIWYKNPVLNYLFSAMLSQPVYLFVCLPVLQYTLVLFVRSLHLLLSIWTRLANPGGLDPNPDSTFVKKTDPESWYGLIKFTLNFITIGKWIVLLLKSCFFLLFSK